MSADREPLVRRWFFREAISEAMSDVMDRDSRVILLGQDVGRFGGAYKEFTGLYDRFGASRVRDMPVSEAAMIGLSVGAAIAGMRPLVSITYMDFLMLGLDPLINYAAKVRFKTAGQLTAPMVVKTTAGARGQGVAHSQCIEAWLMSVPGLAVLAPSTPADAYGLLSSALEHGGPVVFVDHKRLFPYAGKAVCRDYRVEIGKAALRRCGSDVTIVSHSYMTRIALEAAEQLAQEGISCEVLDLRSLAPLDVEAIAESVARTGRLLTLEEGQPTCGVGAEVSLQVLERIGPKPMARVGALPGPVSSNPVLEAASVPDAKRVARTVHTLLGGTRS